MRHKLRFKAELIDLLAKYELDSYTKTDTFTLSDSLIKYLDEQIKISNFQVAQR